MTTLPPAAGIPGLSEALATAGQPASVLLRSVVIGPDALAELPGLVARLHDAARGPLLLVTDAVAYRRGDDADVKETLVRSLGARRLVLGDAAPDGHGRVHADEETVAAVIEAAQGAGLVLTVGSGTLADLGKAAAAHHGIPHVVVQTAASVNGYADDQSVLLRAGAKRTTPTRWPEAVVADTGVIREAPVSLNAAGVGDLLSMFVGPADWLLASTLGLGPEYKPELVELIRPHGARLLALARGIATGDPSDLEDLTRLLTLSGLTMGLARCTAPSSGTEHVISHLLEMRLGTSSAWHGLQVGVSTVVASALWQRVRDHLARGTTAYRLPDVETARAHVLEVFASLDPTGRTAEECWDAYARKLSWLVEHRDRLDALLGDWARLDGALSRIVTTPERLVTALRDSAVPLRFAELGPGYDRATVLWAVANGHRMRDRFTVADLAELLGIWTEQDAAALLDDLDALGAGA